MKRLLVLLVIICTTVFAQAQPFADEITAFKKQDSLHLPPTNAILFVGSSSFRKWQDIQDYFPGYPILNRGFGGATLPDMIRYTNDIILPYHAKQIIIYCGENDIASADSITATEVLKRFITLFKSIRKQYPQVPIAYVSIKPCPLRWKMKDRMMEANQRIQRYIRHRQHARFINIWNDMLDTSGSPDPALFVEDKLHMTASGYRIWKKKINPYLLKK